jgi:hypothetical protein
VVTCDQNKSKHSVHVPEKHPAPIARQVCFSQRSGNMVDLACPEIKTQINSTS